MRRAIARTVWPIRPSGRYKIWVTESRQACAARLRTGLRPYAMRSQGAISRECAARQMTWSAQCSVLARRPTVNLEQPRVMEHLETPVVNLGRSRESIAKSSSSRRSFWKGPRIRGSFRGVEGVFKTKGIRWSTRAKELLNEREFLCNHWCF